MECRFTYAIELKKIIFIIVYCFIFLVYYFFASGKTKPIDPSEEGTMYGMFF